MTWEADDDAVITPAAPEALRSRFRGADYVPEWLCELAAEANGLAPKLHRCEGSVLFTDIAGFSALTEHFYAQGPEGAERLASVSDVYFGRMTAIAAQHGGDVMDFIGDAVVIAWRAPADQAALAAARCAIAMQDAMPEVAAQTGLPIRQRLAITAGELTLCVLTPGERTYWLLAGRPMIEAGDSYHDVEPGEILLCASAARRLGAAVSGSWLPSGHLRLSGVADAQAGDGTQGLAPPEPDSRELERLVPGPVLDQVSAGQWPYPGEFRHAVVSFVGLPGFDIDRDDSLERLQRAVLIVQTVMDRYGGTILHLALDDKGMSVQCAFGLPGSTHEDDPARAVGASVEIHDAAAMHGLVISIGVTRGRLFYCDSGGARRRKLGVVGSPANLASRLMAAGGSGVLCDDRVRKAAAGRYDFSELPAMTVKGESAPVPVFRPGSRKAGAATVSTGTGVGREHERQALMARLGQCLRGHGGFVALIGEAGIGKSQLLSDVQAQIVQLGIGNANGSGSAMDTATPYYPWRRVLASMLETFAGESRAQIDALRRHWQGEPRLLSWLPLLKDILPLPIEDNDTIAQMDGGARAASIRSLIGRLLADYSERRPSAIVFDDLHWFDEASASLLRAVLVSAPRLLVLGGTRPVADGAVAEALSDADLCLPLSALDGAELSQLACRKLGVSSLPPELGEFIHRRCNGHPFYAEELLLALRDASLIAVVGERCDLSPDFGDGGLETMPNTLHGVIVSRIDKLGARQQATLKLASVIGGQFPIAMLSALHGDAAALAEILDVLSAADLIRPLRDAGHGGYAFKHAILRDVIYDLLPYAQRRELHLKVARWIEQDAAGRLEPHYAELALHWERAANFPTAVDYLERAAGLALTRYANREAIAHVRRAYALAREQRIKLDDARVAAWEAMLGDAHHELFEYGTATRHFHSSLARLGDPVARNPALMAGALFGQMFRQARLRLRPAPAAADAIAGLGRRSHMHERLAESAYFDNRPIPLLYHTLASLNLAEAAGAVREMVDGFAALAIGCLVAGLRSLSLHYNRRSIALAETRGTPADRAYAHMVNMVHRGTWGDWNSLAASAEIAAPIYHALGAPVRWQQTLSLVYHAQVIRGLFADAVPVIAEVRSKLDHDAPAQVRCWVCCSEMTVALAQGAPTRALVESLQGLLVPELQRADRCRSLGLIGLAWLRLGDRERALAATDQAFAILNADVPTPWPNVDGLGGIAEVYFALAELEAGDSVFGRVLRERLERTCARLRRYAGYSPVSTAYVEVLRGRLARLAGREAVAQRHWQAALAAAEHYQTPYYAALAMEQLAATAGGAEREALLVKAAAIFSSCGARHALARVAPAA